MNYLRVIAHSENQTEHLTELSGALRRAAWLAGLKLGEMGDTSEEATLSRIGGTLELDSLSQQRPSQHEIDSMISRPMVTGRAEIMVVLEFSDSADLHPGVEGIIATWEENLELLSHWEQRRREAVERGAAFNQEQPSLDCSGIAMDTWVAMLADYSFKF